MHGVVNKDLMPIVQVGFKDRDREWQDISLLLDTGFNREIMLESSLLDSHNLATWPDHQLLTPDEVLASPEQWEETSPYTGELDWYGRSKEVGIWLAREHTLNGMVGTELLKHLRLTVDVVEGGMATVEDAPPPSQRRFPKWQPFKDKHFRTSAENLADEILFSEHTSRYDRPLPWAILDVPDSKGRLQPIRFNVDTGDSGELGLTSEWVFKLGLSATGTVRKHTIDGSVEVEQGEIEISWDRRKRTVKWSCVPNHKVPAIGMSLLKGKRITMYFGYPRPSLQIHNIPRQPRPTSGIFHSLRDRISP